MIHYVFHYRKELHVKKIHLYINDIKIQGFKEGLICVRNTIYIYYSVDGH